MPNPFYFGGHVSPEQFVGRKNELRKIFALLDVTHTRQLQSVSVVGPRRIGKSSLLFNICKTYPIHLLDSSAYRFAYIDLHDPECQTRGGLLNKILRVLHLSGQRDSSVTLTTFQDRILELKSTGGLPIVALDEFEELFKRPAEFTSDFYDAWRHLVNDNLIAFITASKIPLNDLTRNQPYTSPFFNVFTVLPLGTFADAEAGELLARGAQCDRPFEEVEQDLMRKLGELHPARLQLAGRIIYDAKGAASKTNPETVKQEFHLQLRNIGLERPSPTENLPHKIWRGIVLLLTAPKYLGRALLEGILRLEKDKLSESTALIVGWAILILIGLILLGVIRFDDLMSAIDRIRGN